MTLQGLRIPSEELLNLIREAARLGTQLSVLIEAVKRKGHEEGFTDYEMKDLLRTHLKGTLSAGQIKWYLFEKDKHDSRKQLVGTSQVEGNKVIEQKAKQSGPGIKEQNVIESASAEPSKGGENKKTEGVQDLKATIQYQLQYISKLESKLREKHKVLGFPLRIRTSTSQLYRDILRVRINNATYANIMIDENKYVKLESA